MHTVVGYKKFPTLIKLNWKKKDAFKTNRNQIFYAFLLSKHQIEESVP